MLRDCRGSPRERAGSSGSVRLRLRRAACLSPAGMACSRLVDALISPTCLCRASVAGTRIALYSSRVAGGGLRHCLYTSEVGRREHRVLSRQLPLRAGRIGPWGASSMSSSCCEMSSRCDVEMLSNQRALSLPRLTFADYGHGRGYWFLRLHGTALHSLPRPLHTAGLLLARSS